MARDIIPNSQLDLFNDGFWDATSDAILIGQLAAQTVFGNFEYGGEDNSFAYNMAQLELSKDRFVDVSHADIEGRLEFLQDRYLTFDWILEQPGVKYHIETNSITAPKPTWDLILSVKLSS